MNFLETPPPPCTFRGVLQYKWEAYCNGRCHTCSTNRRCTEGVPFLQGIEARNVQRYKWGHCGTNWRCTALVFSRKIITSTGFYQCCAPGASAPVVVKISLPFLDKLYALRVLIIAQWRLCLLSVVA